ncbi:uncharacterized protein L969DRAFT_57619 [Mixia osmundae IAM 14324]|uniref:Uncharacterized protein n=1 Tax=Mixia osmundae (strain CBS 9802 / IAM 14324 / JCM 22182 / KY 12970) TaxID=764103 RepID=G7DT23_MIXOS|nr:uncharacterized protein L969DRAFT_57619 [Mixia osmundae IAM 14324]KEI42764.1 hypothetical protein L969DRAFT_57619 [Mixia osmundae IAM 14324]GAA93902.1 hypothetical protein E5Q_00548 [Mixia osmundae IAM 14324]
MEGSLEQSLDKVRLQTTSQVPAQKKPAIVLEAIEQTLSAASPSAGPSRPSETAYYVALTGTLQKLLAEQSTSDEEHKAAVLYLLALIVPHLPRATLQSNAFVLLSLLSQIKLDDAPIIKSTLTIVQSLYASLSLQQLSQAASVQYFARLLPILIDQRPKVRRKAQETVTTIIKSPPPPSVTHPYGDRVADWALSALEGHIRAQKGKGKNKDANKESDARCIALLVFIKHLGGSWPTSAMQRLCAICLAVPKTAGENAFLATAAFDVLEELFTKSSESFEEGKVADTLLGVLASRPSDRDDRILPGWLAAVEHGFVAFARFQPEACSAILYSNYAGLQGYLLSESLPVRQAAASTLIALTRYAFSDSDILANSKADAPLPQIAKLTLESLTSMRFQGLPMPHLLDTITALFSRLRLRPPPEAGQLRAEPTAARYLSDHVRLIGAMRASTSFEFKEQAEKVLTIAVEVCGPQWLLAILPLNLEPDNAGTEGRAWLLPLLRNKIANTELSHFVDFFVPLSESLFDKKSKAEQAAKAAGKAQGSDVSAKIYEALVEQIWALFPGYCDLPTDLHTSFTKKLGELLSNVLYTQLTLRAPILRGLQLLVERNQSMAQSQAPPDTLRQSFGVDQAAGKQNLALLASYSSNLLAVMFNVFAKAPREHRNYILEAISTYLSISSSSDLANTSQRVQIMLKQALAKQEKRTDKTSGTAIESTAHTMMDLLVAMVPFVDQTTSASLLDLALSDAGIGCSDGTLQKKAYRLLTRMTETTIGSALIFAQLDELLTRLYSNAARTPAAAKPDRILLTTALVNRLPTSRLDAVPTLLPEAILATKESNEKTREAAYDLLVLIGRKMQAGGTVKRPVINEDDDSAAMTEDAPATLEEYFTMVAAGLVGSSPHMISATITALSRLVFDFHTSLTSNTLGELLETSNVFLSSANREIVKSAIGFVKVSLVCLPLVTVQPHLPALVPSLLKWSHEHRNHFKLNIRHIFERLIRKFGADAIADIAGDDDRKLVASIKKRQQREKKKRTAAVEARQDGEDSEGETHAPKQQARNAFDEALHGSEDEAEGSEGDEPAAPSKGRAQKQAKQSRSHDKTVQAHGTFLDQEDEDDDPINLLDHEIGSKLSNVQQPARRRKAAAPAFATDKRSGKLVFAEGDATASEEPITTDSVGAYIEALRGEDSHRHDAKGRVKFNKKRHIDDVEDPGEGGVELVKQQLRDLGMDAKQKKARKIVPTKLGSEFKAKRAGGDVTKNGQQPFAYLPMAAAVTGKRAKHGNTGINITGKRQKARR